jgi:hypothetical protein
MCFSQPDIPPPPPPPAPPPKATFEPAPGAKTQRQMQPTKRRRGTSQLTAATRRPTLSMGGSSGGTGVQLSS